MATGKAKQAEEIREAGAPEDAAVEEGLPSGEAKSEAKAQKSERADRFSRERVLSGEAAAISGHPAHVVAAAIADDDAQSFTRAQLEKKIEAYHAHEDTTGQEEE